MNRRTCIAFFLMAGLAVVGAIHLWPGTGPFYHGHRLSWWVDRYGNFEIPPEGRAEAKKALLAIGTNAVPYLMNWMGSVDSKPPGTNDENFQIRMWQRAWFAATAFSAIGTNAQDYITELKELVANPTNGDVCVVAESALVHMGPDGFAAVLDVIAMPELPHRGALMQGNMLADHMRPPDAITLPGHEDPNFRINSVHAAPVLLKCLGDEDEITRRSAFLMLSFSDPDVMVPALTNFLAGFPPPTVRRAATEALAKHGPDARMAVPFLLSRYRNSDPEIRFEASNALVQIAPEVLAH